MGLTDVDPGAAEHAVAELEDVARRLDELTRARARLGEEALATWTGRRRERFEQELVRLVSESEQLTAELRRAAAGIADDLDEARAEQRRAARVRALMDRHGG